MIHDKAHVENLRTRVAAQLELIKSLEAKIVKGKLKALEIARYQTEDIETFYLRDLERNQRTPTEEALWLSYAERMFEVWGPYLRETEEEFKKFGDRIEIVGG